MTSTRDRRITKELADLIQDQDNSGISVCAPDESDLTKLIGTFPGPPDTVYAGGKFEVQIRIPNNYPFKPPRMSLTTKIWHPNISSQTGAICLDTLGSNWSPVQTIKTALLSVRLLLEVPNPKDPQDAEVASMLKKEPARFAAKAHDWAVRYAGAPRQSQFDLDKIQNNPQATNMDPLWRYDGYPIGLVDRFVAMGFELEDVVSALNYFNIDRNDGIDYHLEEAYMGDVIARLLGES